MSKKSGLRLIQAANAEKKKQALQVFLSMQAQPLGIRARLALILLRQSDVRHFAKKNGMSVKQFLSSGRGAGDV